MTKTAKLNVREYFASIFSPRLNASAYKNPPLTFKVSRVRLIFSTLSINIMSLGIPLMMLQVYDRILAYESVGTLNVLAAGLCVVIILDSILRLSRSYVINWAGSSHEHAIACNTVRHMFSAELLPIEKQDVGKHLHRMTSVSRLREFFSGQSLITLIDLPFVLIYILLIWHLSGVLVLVPIILLIVFVLVMFLLGYSLKEDIDKHDIKDEQRLNFIVKALSGIHTVKALALENIFLRRYEQHQAECSQLNYKVAKGSTAAANYGSIFIQIMMISVIVVGAPMAMEGKMTLGTLIASVLLSARIMQPMQRAFAMWTRYQDFILAKELVEETFEMPVMERYDLEKLGPREGRIHIENVSFTYDSRDKMILNNVNLDMKLGDVISISGDRSSGKSTLLKLIAGLYSPTHGVVEVNGVPSTKYPARELIHHVGYMAMEGEIFKGSILDNLTAFGEISKKQVESIVNLLGLDKEIERLPFGYDTQLDGSDADVIPPGLRQRIAIARVLSSKPRIILFDNADRSLDKEGYNQVYSLLGKLKGKITMIVRSDDKNISRLASKDYVIVDGCLKEKKDVGDRKLYDVLPYRKLRI